ncbi:hypothetical protein TIFTF001_038927 [Ficus carica]|uniref:Uncharacterized protein n=1 Tax=Ficus carica TaxID=3494 RepID=A0AA88E857_FICCA|nr:hypothetical protein TIFTF001_038927 [Ficus carica]
MIRRIGRNPCWQNMHRMKTLLYYLEKGVVPHSDNVQGSNYCVMNVFPDHAITVSVIDNLVKGAGQALQNLNLMLWISRK